LNPWLKKPLEPRYPGGGPAAGVGWLREGTLTTASFSASFHITLYRGICNAAGGYDWTGPTKLPTNSFIGEYAAGDNSLRFIEDEEGTLFYTTGHFDKVPPEETLTCPAVFHGSLLHVQAARATDSV
jgi:hypothetical protein